jgi:hypothetical protein|tara:strand:- start:851 stop:1804 length:954 start_codon:yes stop_codon:yes gene_type:complete
MYPVETRKNYLVLTPDGVGSTYLQRALTVYLQFAELDYWNTHELLNGLAVEDGSLYKDFTHEYTQTVEDICNKLLITGNFLVSRIAHYHVLARQKLREENYADLYKECNRKFNTIIFCARNPFEYALSWGIRNKSGKLNVYSISERNITHNDIQESIDIDYFTRKLDQYAEYEYWAQDNFDITHTVDYDTLHQDVDSVMQTITNMTHTTFLQEYNRLRYTASKSKDNKVNLTITDESFDGIFKMHGMIDQLYNTKRLPTPMPLKMTTMSDKQKRVTNFSNAVDVFNTWALKGNRHAIVTEETIRNKVDTEKQIYADK